MLKLLNCDCFKKFNQTSAHGFLINLIIIIFNIIYLKMYVFVCFPFEGMLWQGFWQTVWFWKAFFFFFFLKKSIVWVGEWRWSVKIAEDFEGNKSTEQDICPVSGWPRAILKVWFSWCFSLQSGAWGPCLRKIPLLKKKNLRKAQKRSKKYQCFLNIL